jgi:formate C-acetyltransferase
MLTHLPERIAYLRDELFPVKTETCMERANALYRSYLKSEGQPSVIRRGLAVREILSTVPLYIRERELLVGARSSRLGWRIAYPEYELDWRVKPWPVEFQSYFAGKNVADTSRSLFTEPIRLAEAEMAACYTTGCATGFGHVIVDYEKAIKTGFRAIINECERKRAETSDQAKRDFYTGAVNACEGIIIWANRYAELAEAQADEVNKVRAAELRRIAEICRRVPEYPARTFHEALQSFVFVHLAMHIEQRGWSISAGRFDQYLYPYYRADIESGLITRGQAEELVLSTWMKFMENVDGGVKQTEFQNLTLGGQLQNGADTSNELSHICLDASMLTGFNQPALSVRWHKNIDAAFWRHAMEAIATGIGMPALFNDEVIINALTHNGISPDDARNYGIVGCVEASVPGKMQGMTAGGHLNMAKALELALNDGVSATSGNRIGLPTGDATSFNSFADLLSAYEKQVKYLTAVNIQQANLAGHVQKMLGHCPLMSCLLDDCVERGMDFVNGGTVYSLSGIAVFGSANAADGMSALKDLVFERNVYTMKQVTDALKADFDGHEEMRQVFIHQKKRFGNDVPEADEMYNALCKIHAGFAVSHPDTRGGHFTCGIWPVNGHVGSGLHTGALPDGRHKGEPVADGVGACQGRDVNGPTALLKSVARLNNVEHWAAGNTCNIKFSRGGVCSPGGIERIESLVDVFMELGGQELQINVVDAQTLKDAQANPREYANLVVRVAGYSAYFTMLERRVQDEIISRTEQR